MLVRLATSEDVAHVVDHLRAADRREVFACRWTDDPEDLIADIEASRPMLIRLEALCAADGEAVALLGIWLSGPRVGTGLMIATERWGEIAAAAHRHVVRHFLPRVAAPNLGRLECRAHAAHAVSRAWLARLGFVEEGVARRLGKAGEDFVHCAWFPPEKEVSTCAAA